MITLKNWRLDIPCSQRPIGYDGENLSSRIAIHTDAGPEWDYRLCMEYSDGTALSLSLAWKECVLYGTLTRPYLSIPGPVKVTVQGQNGSVVKKSNMGMLYVGRAIEAGGGVPGGTSDHRELTNRDAEEQHPIGAIEGLSEELRRIPAPVEALTNQELEDLLK